MEYWYVITNEGLIIDSDPEPKTTDYSILDGGLHIKGEVYFR